MSSSLSLSRLVLVAGVLVLSLSACGRRGAPEAPPSAAVQPGSQGAQAGAAPGTLPSPVGTPRNNRRQGYVIPSEPFILDPLL